MRPARCGLGKRRHEKGSVYLALTAPNWTDFSLYALSEEIWPLCWELNAALVIKALKNELCNWFIQALTIHRSVNKNVLWRRPKKTTTTTRTTPSDDDNEQDNGDKDYCWSIDDDATTLKMPKKMTNEEDDYSQVHTIGTMYRYYSSISKPELPVKLCKIII